MNQNAFFRYIYRSECIFQENKDDLLDIEYSVRALLDQLFSEVSKTRPAFRVSKLIPSGSFYEGTKVRLPDEFDFMLVLDPSPFATSIKLAPGCSPWFKRIFLEDPKQYYGTFPIALEDRIATPVSVEVLLWKCLREVVEYRPITIQTRFGRMTTKAVDKHKLFLLYTQSHPRLGENANEKALVEVKQTEIGVDLMLAFEHPKPLEVIEEVDFPKKVRKAFEGEWVSFGYKVMSDNST